MKKIPLIRVQSEIYVDGGQNLLGLAETTLPNLENMAESLQGAGLLGEIEALPTGQMSASETTMNFRILYGTVNDYAVGKAYTFDVRVANEVEDPSTYNKEVMAERWSIRGPIKSKTPGNVAPASAADASIVVSTRRIQHWVNGVEKLLFDPLNGIYRVNGVDMYAGVRAAIS